MFGKKKYRVEAHSAAEDRAWAIETSLEKPPEKGDTIRLGSAELVVVIVRTGLNGAWVAHPDASLLKKEGWAPCH